MHREALNISTTLKYEYVIFFSSSLMFPVYFSHLDLMKYFPGCNGATKWGECLGPHRPGHSSHIRQPINSHICTEENIDGVIKLEVKLKASDDSFYFWLPISTENTV